ncbi:hypothetical protein EON78_05215 [bacterium]|nr:MAG: hypothetical protein EON78_05215 [bacterium]
MISLPENLASEAMLIRKQWEDKFFIEEFSSSQFSDQQVMEIHKAVEKAAGMTSGGYYRVLREMLIRMQSLPH